MILRTLYCLKQTWRFRIQLNRYITDHKLQLKDVRSITTTYLSAKNVKALVLDFDGVLAAHGEHTPRSENLTWLQEITRAYAPHKIFILSNKPNADRISYFQEYFPSITFVKAARKKPYPDGLQQIIALSGAPATQIMIVDDRLCTGILAALIVGCQGCWITRPYINLQHRFFAEIGFIFLRWLERVMIALSP
jgi:HAD superfamily phosphatase (TIGR01668 family)